MFIIDCVYNHVAKFHLVLHVILYKTVMHREGCGDRQETVGIADRRLKKNTHVWIL